MAGLVLAASVVGTASAAVNADVGIGLYPGFRFSETGSSFYLMGAEAIVTARVSTRTRDLLTANLQLFAPIGMDDWTMGFHFGEAYVMIPLGLRRPTLKLGQAVIPFGLLADYDTHSQIVQTPFSRTLALRIDPGVGFQGEFKRVAYSFWLSNGNGPYALDNNDNKVLAGRVAPRFLLGDAELTLGASALAGELPYWRLDSMMHMMHGPHFYRMKYRAALDNTTDWGPLTLRLEGVAGRDSAWAGPLVYGYFAEARYALTNWFEALAKYDGYHVAEQGSHRTLAGGLTITPPSISAVSLQAVYQMDWMKTEMMNERFWNVAVQLSVRL